MSETAKKLVLAYSGGLDTSVILHWLQQNYHCEVVVFTADLGQGEDLEPVRAKAQALGVREIYIEDLRETFVRDFVFPMLRANAMYEGEYLLGTAIARPLIAKRLAEIAQASDADAVAHGATARGNDQLRFELGVAALAPELRCIAPWREWNMRSRAELLEYCTLYDIPVEHRRVGGSPYSVDENLLHISYEGGPLEDPAESAPDNIWRWTTAPEAAPEEGAEVEIGFRGGDAVSVNGREQTPAALLAELNTLGGAHGIGRTDLVENRCIGCKSRGCYETPGGFLLLRAHRALESITLDCEAAHLKERLTPLYARLIYDGLWWSPERRMLQAAIDESQNAVSGSVRLRLYKGNITILSRKSDNSLYDAGITTFEDDAGALDKTDAEGMIRIQSLRLRLEALQRKKNTATH